MQENYELVQKGFRILLPHMAAYIGQEMSRVYRDDLSETLCSGKSVIALFHWICNKNLLYAGKSEGVLAAYRARRRLYAKFSKISGENEANQ